MPDSNRDRKEILFDGLSDGEILGLPAEQIEALILNGQPMVFRAGSATVLGEFRRDRDRLVVELAQIEGGGEGVLVSLGSLVKRYARLQRIETVEWIVHAVTCAKPNLKLRRVLVVGYLNGEKLKVAHYPRSRSSRVYGTRHPWDRAGVLLSGFYRRPLTPNQVMRPDGALSERACRRSQAGKLKPAPPSSQSSLTGLNMTPSLVGTHSKPRESDEESLKITAPNERRLEYTAQGVTKL